MWLLGRVLPYMIGAHVPEDDSNWQEHDTEFVQLYSSDSVIPSITL